MDILSPYFPKRDCFRIGQPLTIEAPNTLKQRPSYAVVFKAHFWDDFVESQFRRLQSRAGTDSVFVLVDETHGPVAGITHDKVLRITEDISEAEGFYQHPRGNSFWYNTDYPIYHFIGKFPEFKYVVEAEYDVAVNVDLFPIIQTMEAEHLDLVCEHVRTPMEKWDWRKTAAPYYTDDLDFAGRLCCIAIFSQAFLNILQIARKDHLRRVRTKEVVFPENIEMIWPFAEAFVGAEVKRLSLADSRFSAFADTSNYDWWPPYHPDHVAKTEHDAIFHPVLAGERFVKSLLKYPKNLRPESWFETNSILRARLDYAAPEIGIPALLAAFVAKKDANAIVHLWLELHDLGLHEQLFPLSELLARIVNASEQTDLALGKTCSQSSVCKWSRSQILHEDAGNAVDGRITGEYAFHTDYELKPWWMVDLGAFALVSEILLFNRNGPQSVLNRANNLSVWVSLNGRVWTSVYTRFSSIPFGGVDGTPLKLTFPERVPARFLRIELYGTGMLHLAQVKVFGAELTPSKKADHDSGCPQPTSDNNIANS
jgi:hypothetical protein